jgi:AraC-like DNA-binding protein
MRQEKVRFWRVPDLVNLELLQATYITHSFSRHIHETYAIGVIQQGTEAFSYRGEHYNAPANHVVAIHPGETHTGHAATSDGWKYSMLYPDVSLLQRSIAELSPDPGVVPFFPNPVMFDPLLAGWLLRLHRALSESAPRLEQESRLLWTFAQMVVRHADLKVKSVHIGKESDAVQQVREYLEAHYTENVSLEELAAIANLSPFHLLRTFRHQVGLPPHSYLNQVRLIRAKRLLAIGDSISTVAQQVGFADQSHLTRQFKRMWGFTPGQYQQKAQ